MLDIPHTASGRRPGAFSDQATTVMVWAAAAIVIGVTAWIVVDLVLRGAGSLDFELLTDVPRDAGRQGGIASVLVGTALVLAVCMVVAVPLSLGAAVLLAEFLPGDGGPGGLVRRSLDVLAGVPSIVYGLFGNALFVDCLGLGYSILSGGLTLACMVLPFLTRAIEDSLRTVSAEHRSAAAALGFTRRGRVFRVLLPLAVPGIAIGFVLGLGRAMAETAALLFTSGTVDRMPDGLLDSARTLSVHVFDLAMNVPGGEPHAYATGLVLVVLILGVDGLAAFAARHFLLPRHLS